MFLLCVGGGGEVGEGKEKRNLVSAREGGGVLVRVWGMKLGGAVEVGEGTTEICFFCV